MIDLILNDELVQSDVKTGFKKTFDNLESDKSYKVELKSDEVIIDSKEVKTLPKVENTQKYWAYFYYNNEKKVHKLTNDSILDMNVGSVRILFSEKDYSDGIQADDPAGFIARESMKADVSTGFTNYLAQNNYIFGNNNKKYDENAYVKNIVHKTLGSIPDINFKVINNSKALIIPWIDKSKSEIQEELETRDIAFKKSATKSELLEMLGE